MGPHSPRCNGPFYDWRVIITSYPSHGVGIYEAGHLFEMTGKNLNLLPNELVAINPAYGVDEVDNGRCWYLDSVSADGKKAYFKQLTARNYTTPVTFSLLATPNNPPRTQYTDYTSPHI